MINEFLDNAVFDAINNAYAHWDRRREEVKGMSLEARRRWAPEPEMTAGRIARDIFGNNTDPVFMGDWDHTDLDDSTSRLVLSWAEWDRYGDGSPAAKRMQAKEWRKVVARVRASLRRLKKLNQVESAIGYSGRVEMRLWNPVD